MSGEQSDNMEIIQRHLGSIRTYGTRKPGTIKQLLTHLTGTDQWTAEQGQLFYDALLNHYINDKDDLELMLAVSGRLPGYQDMTTATSKRESYCQYLATREPISKYKGVDVDTLRRSAEEGILSRVAMRMQQDVESGKIAKLIATWTSTDGNDSVSPERPDIIDTPEKENLPTSEEIVRTPDPVTPFWGDSDGCRPSFSRQQVEDGILGNKIVFNSIYDGVIGDERNFLGIREDIKGQAEEEKYFNSNYITVEHGKTYVVRVYAHNNSPLGLEAVARDVRVAISVPEVYARQHHITGVIESSNATPRKYWAGVVVRSDSGAFRLEYVYGSARLENNGIGKSPSIKISDDIVTRVSSGGVLFAYDTLDGSIPGCFQYANYVVIRIRALFDIGCYFDKRVRLAGDKHWLSSIHVNVGDEIEFQIQYRNIDRGGEAQNNVIVRDIAMKNLQYKAGSAKLYNGYFPDGFPLDGAVFSQVGTNIGHYAKGGNALVRFTAVAVDEDLRLGANTLISWAEAEVNQKVIQDYTTIVVYKSE